MIAAAERKKMLAVRLCGERAFMRRESVGIRRTGDLHGRDSWETPIAAERAGTAASAHGRERAHAGA